MNEVTLFITSCGRPELLKVTLKSFMQFNTYPITEAIICEDSGNIDSINFIKEILNFPCTIIYNQKRVGQMRSIENGVKLIKTPYVFHCEDDWEFYCHGFIELSMEILQKNEKISQVLLRSYDEYIQRYNFKIHDVDDNYRKITQENLQQMYSFNPSLKKTNIQLLNIPYEDWDDEFTIQTKINQLGLFAVVTKNNNGFVRHIGWNHHINESSDIKYRCQFPGK
jgi:hypothetical protein